MPPGVYDIVVMSAKDKNTTTGKPAIGVNFKIESGPYAGKVLYNQFNLTLDNPNAMSFFFQHMAALGLPRDYFAQLPGDLASALPVVAQALVGRRVNSTWSIRKWQGADRMNLDQLRAASTAGAPPAPPMSQVPPPPPAPVAAPPAPPVPAPVQEQAPPPPPPAPPVAPAPAPVVEAPAPPPPPPPAPVPVAEAPAEQAPPLPPPVAPPVAEAPAPAPAPAAAAPAGVPAPPPPPF